MIKFLILCFLMSHSFVSSKSFAFSGPKRSSPFKLEIQPFLNNGTAMWRVDLIHNNMENKTMFYYSNITNVTLCNQNNTNCKLWPFNFNQNIFYFPVFEFIYRVCVSLDAIAPHGVFMGHFETCIELPPNTGFISVNQTSAPPLLDQSTEFMFILALSLCGSIIVCAGYACILKLYRHRIAARQNIFQVPVLSSYNFGTSTSETRRDVYVRAARDELDIYNDENDLL